MIPIVIILIICAVLVTVINMYSIIIILHCKSLHKASHLAILSLLFGHLLQGSIVIPAYAYDRSDIYKPPYVCDIFRVTYLITNYTCCLSVLIISWDRFMAIRFPLFYHVRCTTKVMARVLICMWTYIVVVCMIPFIPNDRKENCHYNPQKPWVLTMLFGHTLVPFIIVILCYMVIYKKITAVLYRRSAKGLSRLGEKKSKSKSVIQRGKIDLKLRSQLNKTNVTLVIVAAYIFCWGPSLIYYVLQSLCKKSCFHDNFHSDGKKGKNYDDTNTKEIVGFVIKFLTLIDGFLSPLIYCCTNKHFNKERKKLFHALKKKFRGERGCEDKKEHLMPYPASEIEPCYLMSSDDMVTINDKTVVSESTFIQRKVTTRHSGNWGGEVSPTTNEDHSMLMVRKNSCDF